MAGLGAIMGGIGPGLQQGREYQMNVANQMFQHNLANRQLAEQTAARQRQQTLDQQAQNLETLKGFETIRNSPEYQHNYTDAQRADFEAKRLGFLQMHPELDFGGEVQARQQAIQNADNTGGAQTLPMPGPQYMQGSVNVPHPVEGSMAAGPDQSAAPQATATTPTPAPAPQDDAAAVINKMMGPETIAPGAQAATPATPAATPAPSPAQMQQSAPVQQPQAPQPSWSTQGLLSFSDNDPLAGLKQAHNYLWGVATSSPDQISFNDRMTAYDQLAKVDAQLAQSTHERASAGYENVQAGLAPQLAASTIGLQGAQTGQAKEATREMPAESAARIASERAQAGQAGAEARAIPQRVQQEQEQIQLARSGQVLDNAYKMGNLALQQKTIQLELNKFGLTSAQYQIEAMKTLQQMGIDTANLKIALGMPGFNQKVLQQAAIDGAIETDKLGQKHLTGPTAPQFNTVMGGGLAGQQPALAQGPWSAAPTQQVPQQASVVSTPAAKPTQQPTTQVPVGGIKSILGNPYKALMDPKTKMPDPQKVHSYIYTDNGDSNSTKVQVLKYLSIPIPKNLARLASQEMRGSKL